MLVLEWKERAFVEKVNSRCFCWFPAAILVDQNCAPIWRLHTKLYKGAWKVSANNSETKTWNLDKLFIIILVCYNISFSWFLPLDGFQFTFSLRDSENDLYRRAFRGVTKSHPVLYAHSCRITFTPCVQKVSPNSSFCLGYTTQK